MNKVSFRFAAISCFVGFLSACGSSGSKTTTKNPVDTKKDSLAIQNAGEVVSIPPGKYAGLLEKFKPIFFDTLKAEYEYDTKDKKYLGTELTLKEAMSLPLGITENSFGKLSGVYGCYRFSIDSTRIGLIARIPDEYASTSIALFIYDRQKDRIRKEYLPLSVTYGDGGDAYVRTSWLLKTKNKQIQSFVYDYSSYNHEVEDSEDHTIDERREYYLFNCMNEKFDTISKNEAQLKKRFRSVLKQVE